MNILLTLYSGHYSNCCSTISDIETGWSRFHSKCYLAIRILEDFYPLCSLATSGAKHFPDLDKISLRMGQSRVEDQSPSGVSRFAPNNFGNGSLAYNWRTHLNSFVRSFDRSIFERKGKRWKEMVGNFISLTVSWFSEILSDQSKSNFDEILVNRNE